DYYCLSYDISLGDVF
nr:immunoglobulin light chain junction region [Macaca mulatta]